MLGVLEGRLCQPFTFLNSVKAEKDHADIGYPSCGTVGSNQSRHNSPQGMYGRQRAYHATSKQQSYTSDGGEDPGELASLQIAARSEWRSFCSVVQGSYIRENLS